METIGIALVVAAALVLGFLAGASVVGAYVVRRDAARRAALGAAAGIARIGLETLPTRSSADILAGRIRIILGGLPYIIPVLPRRASKEWLDSLDQRFEAIAAALDKAGDDTPQILALLAGHSTALLSMLRAYDVNGILPDDDFVDEWATDAELLAATVEVWRAANPLVATIAEAAGRTMDETSSEQPSSPLTPTAGDLSTSPTA